MPEARRVILYALGILFSTLPPAVATLTYFPLWKSLGAEHVLSGMAVLLLAVCSVPIIRHLKARFRSPSAYVIWLLIFLTFFALSSIAHEMKVISLVGFVGNLIGAVLFKLSRGGRDEELH